MAMSVCVDVGGTFTDAAVLDHGGVVTVAKARTTPEDYSKGILDAIGVAAEQLSMTRQALLQQVSAINAGRFTHGSTIATNAILEKKAGKVGIITTEGFRDVLLFREGPSKNPHNLYLDYPEPYVPRYLTLSVRERMDSEGNIVFPLDEQAVVEQALKLRAYSVEAIAVCYLWSCVNPSHEERTRELIHSVWPEVTVVLSCEVNPQINEYRRFVSAAMDASLRRLVSGYATRLNRVLQEAGYLGEVGMLNAYGGVMSPEEISKTPLYSIDSGPAMAPVAGRVYAQAAMQENNVIVLDMGGTTFDLSCVINGQIGASRDTMVGNEIPGIARVGVHSIGAGGGSIAWIDAGGMLRVGPRSAGSVPGPVCYGNGGMEPTVTDANVVLGYLNPEYFNAGKMNLDREKAYRVIKEQIADKLHVTVYEAASAICGTVNANMIKAIKDVTIWQGVDPREYAMVAGGGACGLHAIALAEGLEMRQILIPRTAGGLSATGGLFSNLIKEFSSILYQETHTFENSLATAAIHSLYLQASSFLDANHIPPERRRIELYMEGRYPSQAWDLTILVTPSLREDFTFREDVVQEIERLFHAEHQRQFGVSDHTHVNCYAWRVRAIGSPGLEVRLTEKPMSAETAHPASMREMYFREIGAPRDVPVYDGVKLKPGNIISGPAIIEEPTTTVVIPPKVRLSVTAYGDYMAQLSFWR